MSLDINSMPVKVRVIVPIAITSAILTSSTAADVGPGETAWTAGTYASGVTRTKDGRKWLSLVADNTATPGTDATKWKDDGPTNKWAMFDLRTNVKTVQASPLAVQLTPGERVNSIGLSGVVGETITISVHVGGVEKWTSGPINLRTRIVTGWYSHFFAEFTNKTSVVRYELPPYVNGVITVTITGSGDVECGALALGNNEVLGVCERQARVTGRNYSKVDRDFAANITSMIQRRSVPELRYRVFMEAARVNRVLPLKDDLNAIPAFYTAIDRDTHPYYEPLQAVAFYRTFDMNLDDPSHATLDLELEAI